MNKYIQNLKIKKILSCVKSKVGQVWAVFRGRLHEPVCGCAGHNVTISWEKFYFQILSFKEVIKIIYKNIERSSENL